MAAQLTVSTVSRAAIVFAGSLVFHDHVIGGSIVKIEGNSMKPTLNRSGTTNYIWVYNFGDFTRYSRGDIVIFVSPKRQANEASEIHVKRIAGVAGDCAGDVFDAPVQLIGKHVPRIAFARSVRSDTGLRMDGGAIAQPSRELDNWVLGSGETARPNLSAMIQAGREPSGMGSNGDAVHGTVPDQSQEQDSGSPRGRHHGWFFFGQRPNKEEIALLKPVIKSSHEIHRENMRLSPQQMRHKYENYILGEDEFWMLGDHRGVSFDSRMYGPVNRTRFLGKALLVTWPLSDIRFL